MVMEIIFSLTLENVSRVVQDLHQYRSHNFDIITTVFKVFHLFYRQMIECDRADGSWHIWKQHKKIILAVIWLDTFSPKSLSQCPNQGSCWYTFHPVGFAFTLQTKVFNMTPSCRLLLAVLDTDWCVSDISVWLVQTSGYPSIVVWMNEQWTASLSLGGVSLPSYLKIPGKCRHFYEFFRVHFI